MAVLANPFGSLFPPERLGALTLRSPGQLHSYPEPVLNYMFLNVRRPPFDDPRVRRALNYATDRARIAELEGGPERRHPDLPDPAQRLPGPRALLPLHRATPAPGRPWSAPDIERARALVAESGTRRRARRRHGAGVPARRRALLHGRCSAGSATAPQLRVLGDDDYFDVIYDPGARVQMGFIGWSPDYASPSTFIEPNFGCRGRPLPPLRPPADAPDRPGARRPGRRRRRRWAAIDRRVTDLAPAVPLTNRRSVDLVSERVGNVQHHLSGSRCSTSCGCAERQTAVASLRCSTSG